MSQENVHTYPLICLTFLWLYVICKISLAMKALNTVLLISLIISLKFVFSETESYYDLCKNNSGHKIYLEFNEKGSLKAVNLTNLSLHNEDRKECFLQIVTCPFCVIAVNFSFLNLSSKCNSIDCCEYIQMFEQSFEEFSSKKICGNNSVSIKSQTRNIIIKLIYQYDNALAFVAEYKSLRNKLYFTETNTTENVITSPYFPSYYLNDLIIEYEISCLNPNDENCCIQLDFSDFQLGTLSIIEFFDWNGQRLNIVTGYYFRPPIIISNGPKLIIRFFANGATGIGFKASYSFKNLNNLENDTNYLTTCGGYVDNLGGGITMMNMVEKGTKNYYCFWIIKPPKSFLHFKTYLYLKIANFTYMENSSELIIYQGTTSNGKILEVVNQSKLVTDVIQSNEHIESVETGFYVSLKGSFGVKSRLAIVYSAFNYKDCFSGSDFLCENHRCIPRHLTCDGFDHCGDGSDEPFSCFLGVNNEPIDRRWYSRIPNYFFPKIDPYSDIRTAILVFILSCLGLVTIVAGFFILLYKINRRIRRERDFQNHLQIITDLLEEEIIDTESIPDDPPVYEAPPNYDEAIKIDFGSTSDISTKGKRKNKRKSKKSHKSKRRPENETTLDLIKENTNNGLIDVKQKWNIRKSYPFLYISDQSNQSKRQWHSLGELITTKTFIKKEKQVSSVPSFQLFNRETASDSELLNFDQNQTVLCTCNGACYCSNQHFHKKVSKKFTKKASKKKYCKFYTS